MAQVSLVVAESSRLLPGDIVDGCVERPGRRERVSGEGDPMMGPVDGLDNKVEAGIDVSEEMSREGRCFCMMVGLSICFVVDGPVSVASMLACMSEAASKMVA